MNNSNNGPVSKGEETHVLNFGTAGRAVLRIIFSESKIRGVLDFPPNVLRRDRRHARRWVSKITKKLEPDPRPMTMTTLCAGRIVAIGEAIGGNVGVLYL